MKRNCAYKYEIRLNRDLRKRLAQHAGVARFAFNWGLGLRISLYSPNLHQQKPYAVHMKDGKYLDKNGKVVPVGSIEAHIPLDEFRYTG